MVQLASNPWRSDDSERLPNKTTDLEPSQILFGIAEFLDEWPGVPTSLLESEERQNRLIKVIAGYPDIDVSTRPLDWALHPKAIQAFELSRAIDDQMGYFEGSSLRSELLNFDMTRRVEIETKKETKKEIEKEWDILTSNCIVLLANKLEIGVEFPSLEALLASVFSYAQVSGRNFECWFDIKQCIMNNHLLRKEATLPDGISPVIGPPRPDPEKYPHAKYPKKWKKYTEDEAGELRDKLLFPGWKFNVTFEFTRVQTWFSSLIEFDRGGSTIQRSIRGGSLLIEAAISSIRECMIEKYGPGRIVVDGGGRITISSPNQDDATAIRDKIWEEFHTFLSINSSTFERLGVSLNNWFKLEGIGGKRTKKKRMKLILKFAKSLPSRRVYVHEVNAEITTPNSLGELVEHLNQERMRSSGYYFNDLNCPFCSGEKHQNLTSKDWMRVTGWIHNPEKYDNFRVCPTHRLCYIVGENQRIRDSTLHRPKEKSKHPFISIDERTKNRPVIALSMLDGNSIGHLFCQGNDENAVSTDKRRRRSFRFNSHWWPMLASSINQIERNGGDSIGAWIMAGDDVLLAEYASRHIPDEKDTSEPEYLLQVLKNLASEIRRNKGINSEFRAGGRRFPTFSFTAGYVNKEDIDGNIMDMFQRVKKVESRAKQQWKSKMSSNSYWMLSENKRNKCIDWKDGLSPEDWIGKNLIRRSDCFDYKKGTKSNCFSNGTPVSSELVNENGMLSCNICRHIVGAEENKKPLEMLWRGEWTPPMVQRCIKHFKLTDISENFEKLAIILSRNEVFLKTTRRMIRVYPPKAE